MAKSSMHIYLLRFGAYVRNYLKKLVPPELRPMAALKVAHTQRVRSGMKMLGERAGFDENALFLAELAGLFHDVGRFEQLRRYGTFEDAKSVNHAELSADTVLAERFLRELSGPRCRQVINAIRHHNMLNVPPAGDYIESVLTLLLRDADKLDIWRVFHERCFSAKGGEAAQNSTLELGRPDTPGVSVRVCEDIMAGRIVDLAGVKNRNDFTLARLAWVFDINFRVTLQEIVLRGYIPAMENALPDFPQKGALFSRVNGYINDMIASQSPSC